MLTKEYMPHVWKILQVNLPNNEENWYEHFHLLAMAGEFALYHMRSIEENELFIYFIYLKDEFMPLILLSFNT